MSSINIITGNFLEAMDEAEIEVVMSFMTERGILWGFSKLLAAEYAEINAMLNVNHAEVVGQWQYAKTFKRTAVMAYISAPEQQRMYQSQRPVGLYEILRSVMRTMAQEGKKKLMLQYPGMSVCGMDIYGFLAVCAEARAGFDIDFYIPVNPLIGDKYQPRQHVKHYDSKAKFRHANHVNFIEESKVSPFDISNFNKHHESVSGGVYGSMAHAFKSAHHNVTRY